MSWQPNKCPPAIKQINWQDNNQMIITAKYGSLYFTDHGKYAILPFTIKSLWKLSVAMATELRGNMQNFSHFELPLPK